MDGIVSTACLVRLRRGRRLAHLERYNNTLPWRTIEDINIKLSAIWVALMLTYLLGDVLRIFSGDFKPGEIGGMKIGQGMWLGIAALMLIPILMVVLSLTLPSPVNRWANIIVATFFFFFNLAGLPTYPSAYDRFLIVAGLVFNMLTVWYAWQWAA